MKKAMNLLKMAAVSLALAATSATWAADPVKIGLGISKTGYWAPAAAGQLNAYQMWVDDTNKAGGLDVAGTKRPIELIVYDDQSDWAKSSQVYEKLISSDKVDLLLSPSGSLAHFSIVGLLERYKFPMVGSSAASLQVRALKAKNIWFPTSAIPDALGNELATMMKQQGVKTVAVNTLQAPFPQEIKRFLVPAIEKAGMKLVVNKEYSPDTKDMTGTMSQIKAATPDAVISLSYPPDSILYMKSAREQNITAPFQFVLVGPSAAFFNKMFGTNLEGIVTIGHWSPYQKAWPKAQPFFDAYVARFGEAPDYLDVALTKMSTDILEQAVAKAGLDKDKLRKEISTDTFDTIDGPVKFDGVQNATTPTMFLQLQGGKGQIVYPAKVATAAFEKKAAWDK
jgi:branched-chain amino acid transport system substrate-binding protein